MNPMNPLATVIGKIKSEKPAMQYDFGGDHQKWYEAAYEKLVELTGYDRFEKVDVNLRIDYEKEYEDYTETRFIMAVEPECDMNCHLLVPKGVENPPLMICLQGHSTGVHISLGRPKFEGDAEKIQGGRDIGIQSVSRGMAALCIEQRGFGERTEHPEEKGTECHKSTMAEIMIGRTTTGGRAWDISRAIDVVEENFQFIDTTRIGLMGNSGGGTATYYTACLDKRIKVAMPSCAVCTYETSIIPLQHCVCNYIPNILRYFKMRDLAGLIAPRPLIIVAGYEDTIFPIEGVRDAFNTIEKIYNSVGAGDKCKLVVGNGGHRFYPDDAWPVFESMIKW